MQMWRLGSVFDFNFILMKANQIFIIDIYLEIFLYWVELGLLKSLRIGRMDLHNKQHLPYQSPFLIPFWKLFFLNSHVSVFLFIFYFLRLIFYFSLFTFVHSFSCFILINYLHFISIHLFFFSFSALVY